LNDTLIIGPNKYKINDYTINLTNGETKFTLFKDIYDWNGYTFPQVIDYTAYTMTASSWYITDFSNTNTESTYLYGSFTGHTGVPYKKLIKVGTNGAADTTFDTANGFDLNTYAFQSIKEQTDGKILATGDFTSYSGVGYNRLIRLNTDATIDTSLVIGTGFNGLTSGIDVDSFGRILVAGSYSTYSGVTAAKFIRLEADGSIDNAFLTNLGTGFNNVTNDVLALPDNSMYVSGYFTSVNGTAKSHLVRLLSGGTIDSTFADGGFTIASSSPINSISYL